MYECHASRSLKKMSVFCDTWSLVPAAIAALTEAFFFFPYWAMSKDHEQMRRCKTMRRCKDMKRRCKDRRDGDAKTQREVLRLRSLQI